MLDMNNYNDKIRELIGHKGFVVLTKAIVALPDVNLEHINDYFTELQIVPRGISYWLSKTLTSLSKQDDLSVLKIPTTTQILNIKKTEYNKFSGKLLDKEQLICDFLDQDVSRVIALCLTANDTNIKINTDHLSPMNKSLQRIINSLVNTHCFNDSLVEIKLNKNETSTVCPDCKETIKLDVDNKKLCICYKFLGKNSLHIYKDKNNTLKVSFSPKWEKENVEMLLKAFQKQI